ncbi:paraneoplastic antigen Ma3 homolog [Pseudophryne corroboree]|uniref:paraneoplastic antigen Ma3 homolog n=1 Tax=Pseudophryne corroboree TaxID=495146 RepID=UPI003081E66F
MEEVTPADVYRWCREKGVEPLCSFGLGGPLSIVSDDLVLKALGNLYGVSQPCVVARWKGLAGDTYAILVSNRNSLDQTLLPSMVVIEGLPGWKIQLVWPEGRDSGEEEAASEEDHGDTHPSPGDGLHLTSGEAECPGNKNEIIGTGVDVVVDKMVSQLERWHYEGGYRRLRIFSGIMPVPAGEEGYDTMREAAVQHSEEWQCPEHIKKQRIVESLRGPAMGVVQATRRSKLNATLKDYIETLDFSFGTLEDVGDLMARLTRTYQEPGETLTHFIYRVDRLLYKIVDKGGIDKGAVDASRMKQVLKGALTTNPVAQRLRCTRATGTPPTLTDLVKEVKLEEVQIEARERNVKKVKVVMPTVTPPPMDDRFLKLIEEQNKKIDQLIALQTQAEPLPYWNLGTGRGISRGRGGRNPIICYSCGQPGHRSFECPGNGSQRGEYSGPVRRRTAPLENPIGSSVTPAQAPQS